MATRIRFKRGSTTAVEAYTPEIGEPVFDIEKKRLYIGDGITAGGEEIGGDTFNIEDDTLDDILDGTNYGKVSVDDLTSNRVDFDKLSGVNTTKTELNQLNTSGCVLSDYVKLHAITSTAAEINYLDNDDLTAADLQKLADLTATAAEINYLDNDDLTSADLQKLADLTSSASELNILDGALLDVNELNILNGVTATTSEINYLDNDDLTAADLDKLADLTSSAAEINYLDNDDLTAADLQKLADLTATAAEINYLDNDDLTADDLDKLADITATAAEINYLDNDDLTADDLDKLADITATAAEINYLDNDDLTADDLDKLADITATAAEINYLDNDDLTAADIQKLADLTATAAEINYLDNDDLTAADIQKLADLTSSASELNILDGALLDVNELNILNGVTATTSEINYLDNDDLTAADLQKLADLTITADDLNQLSGFSIGYDTTGSIVTTDGVQILTNKSISADQITSGDIGTNYLEFSGSSYATRAYSNSTGSTFNIIPQTGGYTAVNVGSLSDRLDSFNVHAHQAIQMTSYSSNITLHSWSTYPSDQPTSVTLTDASGGAFYPNYNGDTNLGTSSYKWNNFYCENVNLTGNDTFADADRVTFDGSVYNIYMYTNTSGTGMYIEPNVTDVVDLYVGYKSTGGVNRFNQVQIAGNKEFIGAAWLDANNYSACVANTDTSPVDFSIIITEDSTTESYVFDTAAFYPDNSENVDLGKSTNGWDQAYANNWGSPAEFPYLDRRKRKDKDGKIVNVDDLKTIKSMKPRGEYDEVTGLELIDDTSIPEWLLHKNRKTGETEYDQNGHPYISINTWLALALGGVKQLTEKSEELEERLGELEALIYDIDTTNGYDTTN